MTGQQNKAQLASHPFALVALVALLLFIPLTVAKLRLGKGKNWLFVADGFYYYSYAVSLVLDSDLDFTNQYQFSEGVGIPNEWERIVPSTGRPMNVFGIGAALLWLPGFLVGHGLTALLRDGATPTGYELTYQIPTYLWSFLAGLLGLWLLYRLLAEAFDARLATLTTIGILFGTALSNYAFFHANMAHWVSAATATAYLYAVYRLAQAPQSLARWLIAGAVLGVSAMVRYQNAALGLLLVGILWQLVRERSWKLLVTGLLVHLLATFIAFIPQMLAWKAIYGAWLTNPYGAYGARVSGVVVNWNLSYIPWLFFWSPLLLLGIYGMLRPMPQTVPPLLVAGIALAVLVQLHVNLSMPEIGGYGVRRMTDFFPYFGFGIANALRLLEQRWGTRPIYALTGVAVALNWAMIAHHYLATLTRTGGFRF